MPSSLPFQGRLLLQSGRTVNTAKSITFRISNSAIAGSSLWTETQNVAINQGNFAVALGSVTAFPTSLFDGRTLYLGIQVATDAEMVPRTAITSAAYAKLAEQAGDVSGRDIQK